MVFGTCTTRSRPAPTRSSCMAEYAVSSPPMVMSCDTLSRSSEVTTFSSSFGSVVGLARDVPMTEPPRK